MNKDYRYIFSSTTVSFINKVKKISFEIIRNEMGLSLKRSRFVWGRYSYSLSLVVFEGSNRIGYFDGSLMEIGLHKVLQTSSDEFIRDIIRHELGHLAMRLTYGANYSFDVHGSEYRHLCNDYGWGESVYKSTIDISKEPEPVQTKNDKVLNQVKKLLSLAQSSESNEAEVAAIKANELLLKYNLTCLESDVESEQVFMARVMSGKRVSALHKSIGKILKTYYISAIYNYGSDGYYFEVIGRRANVELAIYVCNFLEFELKRLWDKAKSESSVVKGVASRNSFFRGVADGYVNKIESRKLENADKKDLIRLDQLREEEISRAYPRLSVGSVSRSKECAFSKSMGLNAGTQLTISKGLTSDRGNKGRLLPGSRS